MVVWFIWALIIKLVYDWICTTLVEVFVKDKRRRLKEAQEAAKQKHKETREAADCKRLEGDE